MDGVKAYTLFAPGTIEEVPGIFPGNTVVYVDEATGAVLQVSPLGTPFAGRQATTTAKQPESEQGAALPETPAQDEESVDAGKVMMGG